MKIFQNLHLKFIIVLAVLLSVLTLLSFFDVSLSHYTPYEHVRDASGQWYKYAPISLKNPMGTDATAYDIFSQIYYGLRTNIVFSWLAGISFVIVGIFFGVRLGFYTSGNNDFNKFLEKNNKKNIRMKIQNILRSFSYNNNNNNNNFIRIFINLFNTFPVLLAVLLLRLFLDGFIRSSNVKLSLSMIFFGIISSPRLANMIIGKIQRLRNEEFIQAAIVMGIPNKIIIFKHIIWYECRFIILYQLAYIMGQATILEVTLKFFGYGANMPWVSWGLILNNMYKFSSPHIYLLFPIIFITLVIYLWMGLAEEFKKAGEKREVSH
ncbi:hypothetical protein KAJ27_02130 [bacterium]|nr:hypothetical protein [bacterium]